MKRRQMKKAILEKLNQDDLQDVVDALAEYSPTDLINHLFTGLCSISDTVRWHSVAMMGRVVSQIAEGEMEKARVIMRRFLWMLNDESGGIGWGAPEAMAEIMAQHRQLREEYLHMLISYLRDDGPELFQDGNFIELPTLQRGLLWGIGRLCQDHGAVLVERGVGADIPQYLQSDDRIVRGMAVWCLLQLSSAMAEVDVSALAGENTELTIYLDGELKIHTTSSLVAAYQLLQKG